MSIPESSNAKKNQAIKIAESILNGSLDVISGSRQLISILTSIGGDIIDSKAYRTLQGFDSQTDHLPLEHDRTHYSPKYLEELDKEVVDYIADFEPNIKDACKEIIKTLTSP